MSSVVWSCVCGVTGTYDTSTITTKTDASLPDAKHQAACGQSVVTSMHESTLARVRERIGGGAV